MTLSWLTIESETGQTVLHWEDVVRIEAFKRDLFVVDLICLAFTKSDETSVEINEEMNGWDTLVDNLPEYLPGCQKWADWFLRVTFPAFELNLTLIYERGEAVNSTIHPDIFLDTNRPEE